MNQCTSVRSTGRVTQSLHLQRQECEAHGKELSVLTKERGSYHSAFSGEQDKLKPPGFSSGS